ncbi:16S rRNA (adenine(1518)-N(6)/adenine(1519)-N(6))-dimethyltransferase RsmA [Mycoplasma sp. Mirounga ES2805-ORL]|uniref:16S rRNA (adenine(1518)-N(6)/adenine(1519)-N(6))- dimethyltransferase RsmA n=1 Tax=Mycoplasma sp. Mirounga ES2805-ORL TaxID=754514 RepID=UPI00197C4FB7|nr:16S rRNA (adenine(1518)-N(6)/adenine(1519)-N(6))-dimethyltransferase RsmA [Mycoplasma sp. Mirounga ES2805-ORL]QSF13667.1 ribosomal RNA small subunit methyltransferase A [Mycoplasma sp. Mirounga ES2805-ORL]
MFQKNNKIQAKKRFGQNFLIDNNYIEKIINVIHPKNENIIEIGPGMGAISREINKSAKSLIGYEIDKDMIDYLINNKIFNSDNLINEDFLKSDLKKYHDYVIVGNIPYNLTSDIILKILDYRFNFKKAVLMVQKEVADRIVSQINSKDYSKLSVTCQYVANVKKEFIVPNGAFNPAPKVDSAIISLEFKHDKNDNYPQLKNFFKLCFLARRKKLIYSLKTKYSLEKIKTSFSRMNLSENTRIQELSVEDIVLLFKDLNY